MSEIEILFRALRAREFSRLDATGHTYLDYTGSALAADSHVAGHAALLRASVLGNPHSDSPASRASTCAVEHARAATLRFFDADPAEYEVVFTANASGALRLVGEAFPFAPGSRFVLAADNHNSVNGIRRFAAARGAEVRYVPLDGELRLCDAGLYLAGADRSCSHLFAFPAQSNFSGVRHALSLVHAAREAGFHVLLDAAAFVPTAPLRLRDVPADFVALSFYKMFGYPTGLGALIARREALERLERPWFAGGTVDFVSTHAPLHALKAGAEAFEDGTPDFLSVSAVPAGFELLERVGMARLGYHVAALTGTLLRELAALRHANGAPLVRIHGPRDLRDRGGTVALNLLDADGRVVDYRRVEAAARQAGISLRGGCFCNPGAAEHAFGFTPEASARCFGAAARDGFDLDRLRACLGGVPVGAIRISVGMANVEADVTRVIGLLKEVGESLAGGEGTNPQPAALAA
ncbi:MAG TPA: aminotransferase class V-fold PLP-dependent enzyme [Longimicrobium sp.]|nr:aminotransferase class V-fold PLP-dependent enzyme [Longimicrobium sp.]